jgi:hypothetical protein
LIFYVSLLKRDIFNSTVELELVVYYVWKALVVLDIYREVLKGSETITHVLMHWKVKPLEEATWEEENVMAWKKLHGKRKMLWLDSFLHPTLGTWLCLKEWILMETQIRSRLGGFLRIDIRILV